LPEEASSETRRKAHAEFSFQVGVPIGKMKSSQITLIAIAKPDGKVQTGPEREIVKGLAYDLFIGSFGSPVYQYSSESHGGYTIDCQEKWDRGQVNRCLRKQRTSSKRGRGFFDRA
jgi:hypothetical protein